MSLRLFKCLLLLLFLFFWTNSVPALEQAGPATVGLEPVIEIPETTFDFGNDVTTDEVVHEFKVRNMGTAVLVIKKVTPG